MAVGMSVLEDPSSVSDERRSGAASIVKCVRV